MEIDNNNDMTLIWCLAIFGLSAIGSKFTNYFFQIIKDPKFQISIALGIGIILSIASYFGLQKFERYRISKKQEASILGFENDAVFCGSTTDSQDVFIKTRQRAMHTQVIGTTNAGKTESVILPWAIQDIIAGRGLILIDGKADRSLLDKLWAYTVKAGRQKDFRLFSLSNIESSDQFNPLIGGTPEEITERVFNAFEFENPHYRNLQYEVFAQVMRIFTSAKIPPTFQRLHQAISDPQYLKLLAHNSSSQEYNEWIQNFSSLPLNDRLNRTSGLTTALSHFAFGETAQLFNSERPAITLDKALTENLIVYFQLPVLLSPFLGKATGKLVLQSLQASVANRHRGNIEKSKFFSVFLDDFSEYLYPGFVTILNKSRSANVGIVFAHQALGDIKALGDAVANSVLTNANLKVFMRGNDPDSAEYFSSVIGTVKAMKYTERAKKGFIKSETTGDQSLREVDEFIIHPNKFKKDLGVGEGIMIVPHERGSLTAQVRFQKWEDLPSVPLEKTERKVALPLKLNRPSEKSKPQTRSQKEIT
ncbi:MAG TPA: TraM recognition domain-containing protein [Pseudobdellovibrionaceae bacterium]|nr:TraM recognition domain-containing protein [Pseudobdellovibrionaceae bacterium]